VIPAELKIIPLRRNSKLPVGQWRTDIYCEFDFTGNRAVVIGDNYCVLDVEGIGKKVSGVSHINALQVAHGNLPATLSWSTPSGGVAMMFRSAPGVGHVSLAHTFGLELRTGAHYHLIPDSVVDGKKYEWIDDSEAAEIPDWLIDFFSSHAQTKPEILPSDKKASHEVNNTISYYLSALQALNSTCEYAQWVKIGMAAKSAGISLEQWTAWSQSAENACVDETEYAKKWDSFQGQGVGAGTLVDLAKAAGWKPEREEILLPPPVRIRETLMTNPDMQIKELRRPLGLLLELTNHFEDVSNQPQFSLGAALFVLTAIVQRAYKFNDAPQNGYHVLIGESGARKSTVMSAARLIVSRVAASSLMNDPRSVANFKKQLSEEPNRALSIDEIGHELIKQVYTRYSMPQYQEKVKLLLELHGCPDIILGHGTADKETKTGLIYDPRVSIIATATRSDLEQLCSQREFVDGGLFSRMACWQGLEVPSSRFVFGQSAPTCPTSVIDSLKALRSAFVVAGARWEPKPFGVCSSAAAFWGDVSETELPALRESHQRARSAIDRHFHQGIQFAYLHALGRGLDAVGLVDAVWGMDVSLEVLRQSLEVFKLHSKDAVGVGVEHAIEHLRHRGPSRWRDVHQTKMHIRRLSSSERSLVKKLLLEEGTVFVDKHGFLTLR